ncbi:MAG: hypothetical protein DI529_07665 [Chryseobacterium sp.]|nr:MAG: hypothetical protein DI529_07665 [Chryseobacterium sp.]
MKKIILLSGILLLWNCKKSDSIIKGLNDRVNIVSDSAAITAKIDKEIPEELLPLVSQQETKAIMIAPFEGFQTSIDGSVLEKEDYLADGVHEISEDNYRHNFTTFKKDFQISRSLYKKILGDDFKKRVEDLNSNDISDEYIKFNLPITYRGDDITYEKAKNGFCDFADGVSVYHEKFLNFLINKKNLKAIYIIKGRENVNLEIYNEICGRQLITSKYTEGMFDVVTSDMNSREDIHTYYNLSQIPTKKILKIQYNK